MKTIAAAVLEWSIIVFFFAVLGATAAGGVFDLVQRLLP